MSTASKKTERDQVAEAIRATLISPNVSDSNFEAANIVDVIDAHGDAVIKASINIASAIHDLAEAIRGLKP